MKYLYAWLPAIVLMGFIFYLSSRTRISVSEEYLLNFLFFKSMHVGEYALLTLLMYRGYRLSFPRLTKYQIVCMTVISALCYAASDEIHQTYVPTREGTIRDVFIDTIGISLAIGYTKWYWQHFKGIFLQIWVFDR